MRSARCSRTTSFASASKTFSARWTTSQHLRQPSLQLNSPGAPALDGPPLSQRMQQHAQSYVMGSERLTHREVTGQQHAADAGSTPRIELF